MLGAILESLQEAIAVTPEVTPEVKRLMNVLKDAMSRTELMKKLRLKDEKNFRVKYLQRALDAEIIERTVPDKPNSRLQKYRLTAKGIGYLRHM